jgi:hypothetical protein
MKARSIDATDCGRSRRTEAGRTQRPRRRAPGLGTWAASATNLKRRAFAYSTDPILLLQTDSDSARVIVRPAAAGHLTNLTDTGYAIDTIKAIS